MTPQISIIVPVLNERDNVDPLCREIDAALNGESYEIVLVDDGSTDGTTETLERLAQKTPSVRCIILARNYGQTAALAAGFKHARGELLIPIDGDGQNDPRDIPALLSKATEGYEVVSGWRKDRQDPFWLRRVPSWIANALIARVTGVPIHDFGCTLKLYRRSTIENLRLHGEMHRLLPAWCAWHGARIAEIPVQHRARWKGQSKYGLGRTMKVLLDLLTTEFIGGFLAKPSYLFGGLAFVLFLLGGACSVFVFYDKFGPDQWAPFRIPLMLAAGFLWLTGTLLLMIGLLAELIVHVYYDVTNAEPYSVRRIVERPN